MPWRKPVALGMLVVLAASALLAQAPAPTAPAATAPAAEAADPEVARLIRQLSDDSYERREEATHGLIELGLEAQSALQEAAKSGDAETVTRARAILREIARISPQRRETLRQNAAKAFARGDYEVVASRYRILARDPYASVDDCLWVGHAYQLLERWPEAVAGYERAAKRIDGILAGEPPQPVDPPEPTPEGGGPAAVEAVIGPVAVKGREPLDEHGRRHYRERRAALLLAIGRLQREVLGDPVAAAATLRKTTTDTPLLTAELGALQDDLLARQRLTIGKPDDQTYRNKYGGYYHELLALEELARVQEQTQQSGAALATLSRVRLLRRLSDQESADVAVLAMHRALQKVPAGQVPVIVHPLVMLEPEKALALRPDTPEDQAKAWRVAPQRDGTFLYYALCAPPGQELATLDLECDVSRHAANYALQVSLCGLLDDANARVSVGELPWPTGLTKPERRTLSKRYDIPAGLGLVVLEIYTGPVSHTIHRATVRATVRPRTDAVPEQMAKIVVQNECLPKGGKLTLDGRPAYVGAAHHGVPAGKHVYEYALPDRPTPLRVEVDLVPGRRYGLFIHADSPAQLTLTNLAAGNSHPRTRRSLVRLPDGRWLLAAVRDGAIVLTTSKDLLIWEPWWTMEKSFVFQNGEPTLLVDDKGTIWMTWSSNRLSFGTPIAGRQDLWLSSSKDGRSWTRPRSLAVEAGPPAGSGTSGTCMLRGPDGVYWVFWREYAASAASPAEWASLTRLNLPVSDQVRVENPHVAFDGRKRMYMVFDNAPSGIYWSWSEDGRTWTHPACLIAPKDLPMANAPQIYIDGDHAAVVCSGQGAFLCRGKVEDGLRLAGPPLKLTNHTIPLDGSSFALTPDQHYVALAGDQTLWLLRCEARKLLTP